MERNKLQPFTESEKIFSTENHNLIYKFLRKYGYSIDDYYNIAVMGFLKSVQVYHRREELRKKVDFPYIAYMYMRAELSNHFKTERAEKRKPTEIIISLDADYAEMENFYNCIGGKTLEAEYLEMETMLELLENFSELQRKIIQMKMDGYNNKEICLVYGINSSTYYKEMNRIKAILMEKLVVGKNE